MKLFIIFSIAFLVFSCQKEKPIIEEIEITYPDYFPAPVYDFTNNQFTQKRFLLGKKIFFDKQLSSDGTISCNSCHAQTHGFADHNVSFSLGVNGAIGSRNSPSIANMIWSPYFMWDGGVNHIEVFSVAPITNPDEMHETMSNVLSKLNSNIQYRKLFKEAYGSDLITDHLLLKAITLFMSKIISCNSKYDKMRQGKVEYNSMENEGYDLFKQKCASCHTEPLFTNYQFINNGIDSVFTDLGRAKITFNNEDRGKFKVPSLRNIELTYPYMHDGRFWSLEQVLNHYRSGIRNSETLHPTLTNGIEITELEQQKIISFLRTLTDYNLMGDPLFY
jgi:cytochrome c peroxidase